MCLLHFFLKNPARSGYFVIAGLGPLLKQHYKVAVNPTGVNIISLWNDCQFQSPPDAWRNINSRHDAFWPAAVILQRTSNDQTLKRTYIEDWGNVFPSSLPLLTLMKLEKKLADTFRHARPIGVSSPRGRSFNSLFCDPGATLWNFVGQGAG